MSAGTPRLDLLPAVCEEQGQHHGGERGTGVPGALEQGIQHHQQGRLHEAERLYRDALHASPRNFTRGSGASRRKPSASMQSSGDARA